MTKGRKKLYTYAVVEHKLNTKGDVVESIILVQPTTELAASEKTIVTKAARAIPEDSIENADNIDIIVRPF